MNLTKCAQKRTELAPSVLSLYAKGIGHKTIAEKLGISPRLARTILIEQKAYKPWALHSGGRHAERRNQETQARRIAKEAAIPAWKKLEQSRLKKKKRKAVLKFRDLELFKHAERLRTRPKALRKWHEKYHGDKAFKAMNNLRTRLWQVARCGRGYSGDTIAWLGCTADEFIQHIESQFSPGMTWENSGTGEGKWHIDHITPISFFNMNLEDERLACFHWSNHQPMWSLKNMSLGHKGMKNLRRLAA